MAWGAVAGAALSYLGSKQQAKAAEQAGAMSAEQLAKAAQYYAPYRNIGERGAQSLMDFIYGTQTYTPEQTAQINALNQRISALQAGGGGGANVPSITGPYGTDINMLRYRGTPTKTGNIQYGGVTYDEYGNVMDEGTTDIGQPAVDNTAQINALKQQLAGIKGTYTPGAGFGAREPTMEEVMAGQGYKTRLGAIESSAAARGGLFSGNALRNIGEFGSSEFERERARRQQDYQQRLANIMGVTGMGMQAAGGSAGIAQQGATQLPSYISQAGQAMAQPYQFGAGLAGQYQARQDWTNALKQYQQPVYGDAYMPAYQR